MEINQAETPVRKQKRVSSSLSRLVQQTNTDLAVKLSQQHKIESKCRVDNDITAQLQEQSMLFREVQILFNKVISEGN